MYRRFTSILFALATTLAAACSSPTDATPGPPTELSVGSGNNQQATVGATLAAPIVAHVTDAKGRGVPNVPVQFTVTSGGGQLPMTELVTDSRGNASATWTLGTSSTAPQRVTAHFIDPTNGGTGFGVVFSATGVAGPPALLLMISGFDQSAREFTTLPQLLSVRVTDRYQNPLPNVPVTFAVASGGGRVSPTTVLSAADGTASTSFTLGAFGLPQLATASIAATGVTFTARATGTPTGTSVTVSGRPYALAVSSHDVVYVGLTDAQSLARFDGSSTVRTGSVPVGNTPTEIAFNATGTTAYVTNQFGNSVGVIDVATNAQTKTIPVTGNPFQVIVSPDGTRIYVTTNADQVYAIDPATGTVVGQLPTGATANGLAVSPDGSKLYVSTRAGGSVLELNAATMTLLRTFSTGGLTQAVVVAPDASELYIVTEGGNVWVYNLASGNPLRAIDLGGTGFGLVLSPDGTKLYATVMSMGAVQAIDRATRTIIHSYFVDGRPRRIGVTSDGTIVVANEAGYVTWLR